jgi:hypothetical protein
MSTEYELPVAIDAETVMRFVKPEELSAAGKRRLPGKDRSAEEIDTIVSSPKWLESCRAGSYKIRGCLEKRRKFPRRVLLLFDDPAAKPEQPAEETQA